MFLIIQVLKYLSIEFTNWVHIIIIITTYNVKTRDTIGSKKKNIRSEPNIIIQGKQC